MNTGRVADRELTDEAQHLRLVLFETVADEHQRSNGVSHGFARARVRATDAICVRPPRHETETHLVAQLIGRRGPLRRDELIQPAVVAQLNCEVPGASSFRKQLGVQFAREIPRRLATGSRIDSEEQSMRRSHARRSRRRDLGEESIDGRLARRILSRLQRAFVRSAGAHARDFPLWAMGTLLSCHGCATLEFAMEPAEIARWLEELRIEHRDLDEVIKYMIETRHSDSMRIQRLKKRKLRLKDMITKLESELIPNLDA